MSICIPVLARRTCWLIAGSLMAVVPSRADTVYVSNYGDSTVTRITADGQKSTYGAGLRLPYGLAFDRQGNLLSAAGGTNRIYSISTNGLVRTYATVTSIRYVAACTGLAFDARGNLFVADQGNNAIIRISPSGTQTVFASGQFLNLPFGMAFDQDQNLYVASFGLGTIWRFAPDGAAKQFATGLSLIWGLAFDGAGNLFVSGSSGITRISPDGTRSVIASGFSMASGLAFDSGGNLYVVDQGTGTVYSIAPDGSKSTLATGLNKPLFIAVEPDYAAPQLRDLQFVPETGFHLTISGGLLQYYQVNVSSDLQEWFPCRTQQVVGALSSSFWDHSSTGAPNQFYRVSPLVVPPPEAFTAPAFPSGPDVTLLRGAVNPKGKPTLAWFEWGTTTNLGSVTLATNVSGERVVWVSAPVPNLPGWQPYFYRLVASNRVGLARGALQVSGLGRGDSWGTTLYGLTNVPKSFTNLVSVAAGEYHSVALRNDGTVVAWGNRTNVPPGLSNVVAVTCGTSHSLALRSNGTVIAWGSWVGGATNVPANLSNVVAISAGTDYSLALRRDGTVAGWGSVTIPSGLTNIVAIAAGGSHCLALRSDGTVAGWGSSVYRQTTIPTGINDVVAVAAGANHSVLLRSTGKVIAFGRNNYGQTNTPASLGNVLAIAAGWDDTLALRADGTMTAWGLNTSGQATVPAGLANVRAMAAGSTHTLVSAGNNSPRVVPQELYAVRGTALVITLGATDVENDPISFRVMSLPSHGVLWQYSGTAISSAGTAVTDPGRRIIYVPSTTGTGTLQVDFEVVAEDGWSQSAPGLVSIHIDAPPQVFTAAASSVTGTAAVLRGTVNTLAAPTAVWFEYGPSPALGELSLPVNIGGTNKAVWITLGGVTLTPGQPLFYRLVASNNVGVAKGPLEMCGVGSGVIAWGANDWGQTNVPADLTNITALAGGESHSLALRSDGTVAGWGFNYDGQASPPVGLSSITAIVAGKWHSLALRSDGTVVAWGDNRYDQTNIPTGLKGVVAIAAGDYHNLALRADGTVAAWGYNYDGETLVPVGLSNVVAVSASAFNSFALRSDGTVVAWGSSGYGRTTVPPDLTNVVALAHAGLSLLRDGTVYQWGDSSTGQPGIVPGLTNVIAISGGVAHNAALRADGSISVWGDNASGQANVPPELGPVMGLACGGWHTLVLLAATSWNWP